MSDKWEECPRCGSNNVKSRGTKFYLMIGIGVISFSLILLIIPPIGIGGLFFGALLVASSFFMKDTLQCQECDKSWKYPYAETN